MHLYKVNRLIPVLPLAITFPQGNWKWKVEGTKGELAQIDITSNAVYSVTYADDSESHKNSLPMVKTEKGERILSETTSSTILSSECSILRGRKGNLDECLQSDFQAND